MRATQFIPEKYKLYVRRFGNTEVPFATPRPFSTTPEVQKEINRILGGYSPKDIEYDNTPLSGYHIMVDGTQSVQVFHPDGYSIELTMYNIGILLRECQIDQGIIADELIFIFDKSYREYILVPYNRDTYQEIKKQSDEFYAAKTGSTELTYGCCVDFNGNKFVYLGKYWTSFLDKKGIKIVERYIIRGKHYSRDSQYFLMTTRKPDAITDEFVVDYPEQDELFDDIQKNEIQEIVTFYKSGSFNNRKVQFESYNFSTEKPNKKDFKFDYTVYDGHGYGCTLENLPVFKSNDGNIYAALNSYSNSLAYSLSTYDLGGTVKAVPFDVSTLTADLSRGTDGRLSNVSQQRIMKIVIPKLVK